MNKANRLLPKRAPVVIKTANILDLVTIQDRESLEIVANLFEAMMQGVELHRGCCDIFSQEAMNQIAEHRAYIVQLIELSDAHARGDFLGFAGDARRDDGESIGIVTKLDA